MITSVDNPRVKEVVRLRSGRERRRLGLFVAEGPREVERARAAGLTLVATYFAPELLEWHEGEEVSERVLAKMAYRAEPEGVLAVVEAPARELPRGGTLYLVAVGIEKPGNLGAMARTAEAAGADALVVAEAQADVWNPNAIRASTGAVFTLPVVEATLDDVRGARRPGRRGASSRADDGYTDADLTRADRARRRRRGRGPRRALARRGRPRRRDPDARHARPTASTPRPPPRSCSSRRCASVVSRDDVLRARETIGDRLPRTPMLASRTLGARLKCELFQRTGSFKSRGALNRLSTHDARRRRRRGVIAISAGNHAQAVAYAAAEEGVDALVVMWQGASELKIAATRGYGAAVDLEATGPGRGVRAARAADRRDRPHARAPARRPAACSPAPARSGSRSRRTRPTPTR